MKKVCIFCGIELNKRNKSNEHIIPQWLLDHLSIRDFRIEPTHMTSIGNLVSQRIHTLDGLLFGNVCEKCNGGWMCNLEIDSKQILIDLIDGNKSVNNLSENERFIISRWALKTALTLNAGSNFHKYIPETHYRELYEISTALPKGIIIAVQQYNNSEAFYWQQGASWSIRGETLSVADVNRFETETYKITFSFGQLVVSVTYLPFADYLPALWKGIHIPLYPAQRQCMWYERSDFPWNDTIEAVVNFHLGLEAIKKTQEAENRLGGPAC